MSENLPPSVRNSMPKPPATDLGSLLGEIFVEFGQKNLAAGMYGGRRPDPLDYARRVIEALGLDPALMDEALVSGTVARKNNGLSLLERDAA